MHNELEFGGLHIVRTGEHNVSFEALPTQCASPDVIFELRRLPRKRSENAFTLCHQSTIPNCVETLIATQNATACPVPRVSSAPVSQKFRGLSSYPKTLNQKNHHTFRT